MSQEPAAGEEERDPVCSFSRPNLFCFIPYTLSFTKEY
jgi:hypothetical protein